MWNKIKTYWNERIKEKTDSFDYDNCWVVDKIYNKNEFLSKIIKIVPNESVWNVYGVFDKDIVELLSEFRTRSLKKKNSAYQIKINLNKNSKRKILKSIHKWDLDKNFISQSIYKKETSYFSSNDNLHNCCTSVSFNINEFEMENLKNDEIIEYKKRMNSEY